MSKVIRQHRSATMGPMLPVPASLVWSGKISARGSLLYGLLRSFEGIKGDAFPSMGRIAAKLGITIRQAQRTVAELEKLKLIEVSRRGHQHRGSVYRFLDSDLLRTPEPEALERDERWGDENVTAESDENVADQFRSDENVTGVGDENVTARSDENVTAYERFTERFNKRDSLTDCYARESVSGDKSESAMAGATPTNSQLPTTTATTARSTDLTPPSSARPPSLKSEYSVDDRKWLRVNVWERLHRECGYGEPPAWGEAEKMRVRSLCARSGGILAAAAIMTYAITTWRSQLKAEIEAFRLKRRNSTPVDDMPSLRYMEETLSDSEMREAWRRRALEMLQSLIASDSVPPMPSMVLAPVEVV